MSRTVMWALTLYTCKKFVLAQYTRIFLFFVFEAWAGWRRAEAGGGGEGGGAAAGGVGSRRTTIVSPSSFLSDSSFATPGP